MRNRTFLVLALSVFSSTLGIGMVSPILPVVAADLGASGVWLGLSFSAFAISQGLSTLLIGRLSDRWGRRTFIYLGFTVYGTAAVGYALSSSVEEIILWRFITGFGTAAVFPIALAYIGDMSPRGREGTYLGTFNVAMWIGFGAGPLIGGVVRDAAGSDAAFWTMAAILYATAALVALLLPAHRPRRTGLDTGLDLVPTGTPPAVPLRSMLRDFTVRGIMVFSIASSAAFGVTFGFLAVYMENELAASAVMIGVVLALRTWINGLLSPLFGRMADRYDRGALTAIGLSGAAVATFFLPDMGSIEALLAITLVAGVAEGISWPSVSAIIVDKGRLYGMGALMGLRETAAAAGLLGGSLIGGGVAQLIDLGAAFRFAAIVMVIGALLFLFLVRRDSTMTPAPAGGQP